MEGFIDELNQAFLTVDLGQGPLDFQIDTGFNGAFVIGTAMLNPHRLELDLRNANRAIGSQSGLVMRSY